MRASRLPKSDEKSRVNTMPMATPAALAPAAALGIRSSGLGAGGDLGLCGRDGGRSGGKGREEERE